MFSRSMPMADRISNLPDSILWHILSFLPTKQAVATSVLSKRWRPLWLSVPALDFDDRSYLHNRETYFRFLQSVHRIMLLQDRTQPIKRFCLKCVSSFCDPSIVNAWVMTATHRTVEHLNLLLPSTTNLPSCVVTSRTLVVLKLRGLTVDSLSSVSFPSLKILHLRKVHFLERGYLIEILSACPVLEVLLMKFLKVTNFLTGGQLIHLPKLVKADISKSSIHFPLIGIYSVEFLRAEVVFPFVAHTFFNLTYMELSFLRYYWYWLIDLLYYCPRLQNLVIDKMEWNTYSRQSDDEDEDSLHPQFVPECLSSQLKRYCVRKYGGQESELQFTKYIMHNAGVLCTVKICSIRSSSPLEKLEMIKKLSLCPRSSVTCQLYFE